MSAPTVLDRRALRASANEQVATTLRPLLLASVLLIALSLLAAPFTLPGEARLPVMLTEALLGAAFLLARHAIAPGTRGVGFVHPVMAMLIAGSLTTTLTTMAATGNLLLTSGIALIILGAGVIALSWPWLVAMLVVATGGWLLVLVSLGLPEGWDQLAFTLAAACMLATMAHHTRLRTHERLENLRALDARHRAELEDNVRELHETAGKLRSVMQAAPLILLATDREGRVTLAEGNGLTTRGWDGASVIGRDAREFLLDTPAEREGLVRALAGQASSGVTQRDEGAFETFWSPVLDADKELAGAICVATDVTARVRAETEARKLAESASAIQRLQEMDRFKTRILNTASHELNTPLTPIKVQMHLLKMGVSAMDARQARAVGVLDRNVERLASLVGDIMDVAKLQGGQLRLVPTTIDLAGIVRETYASYEDVAASKGVTLTMRDLVPMPVHADQRRITQILFNLLSNAMKFTPEGGRVRIAARIEAGFVIVDVEDSGEGLSPEQRARLFLPFSQVHDPVKSPHGGTGLGLYISRGIAEQHGGSLTCASDGLGKGTTFTLSLPCRSMTHP